MATTVIDLLSTSNDSSGNAPISIASSIEERTLIMEAWENTRYKPLLGGGWYSPYSLPRLSDVSGQYVFPFDNIANTPSYSDIKPPDGYEWLDEWIVDHSSTYGSVDKDGWAYSSTFDKLIEASKKKTLIGDKATLSIVRRRRWLRKLLANTAHSIDELQYRKKYYQIQYDKVVSVINSIECEHNHLIGYESTREVTCAAVLQANKTTVEDSSMLVSDTALHLQALKTYLLQRGSIERSYAENLIEISSSTPFAATTVTTGNDSSNMILKFMQDVNTANVTIANRYRDYSLLLSNSLSMDVSEMIDELSVITNMCKIDVVSGIESIALSQERIQTNINRYNRCYELTMNNLYRKRDNIHHSLIHMAAVPSSSNANASSRDSITTRASTAIAAAATPSPTITDRSSKNIGRDDDLWISLQLYQRSLEGANSTLLGLISLVSKISKDAKQSIQKVASLIQSTIKIFAHEQSRIWYDSATHINSLSSLSTVTISNSTKGNGRNGIGSNSKVLRSNDDDAIDIDKDIYWRVIDTDTSSRIDGGGCNTTDIATSNTDDDVSRYEHIVHDTSALGVPILSIDATTYSMKGCIRYCLISDKIIKSNTNYVVTWEEGTAVITYNDMMYIYSKDSSDYSDTRYDTPVHTIDFRKEGSVVAAIIFPVNGSTDNSVWTLNNKYMFSVCDTEVGCKWMKLTSNPLCDPSIDPPEQREDADYLIRYSAVSKQSFDSIE